MLFTIDFATEFSSFRVNPKTDKYLSNISNPILPMRHNEAPGPEIENEDEKDLKNLNPRSLLFKKGIQHSPSIFDRHNFQLWDYVINTQDSCYSAPVNYKKVCQAI